MCASRGLVAILNYMKIKQILDRKIIQLLVQEIHDHQRESKLDLDTAEREMEAMEKKIERYNVAQLGDIATEWEDGTMQILVCQMGGCASIETRGIKIAAA
jgi:hypothetical protein